MLELNTHIFYDPTITFLSIYSKEISSYIHTHTKNIFKHVHSSIMYSRLETTQMAINSRMDELWYIHIIVYYTTQKKSELLPYMSTWLDLTDVMLRNRRQKWNTYQIVFCAMKSKYRQRKPTVLWWCISKEWLLWRECKVITGRREDTREPPGEWKSYVSSSRW